MVGVAVVGVGVVGFCVGEGVGVTDGAVVVGVGDGVGGIAVGVGVGGIGVVGGVADVYSISIFAPYPLSLDRNTI